jgi:hypothetical protein
MDSPSIASADSDFHQCWTRFIPDDTRRLLQITEEAEMLFQLEPENHPYPETIEKQASSYTAWHHRPLNLHYTNATITMLSHFTQSIRYSYVEPALRQPLGKQAPGNPIP